MVGDVLVDDDCGEHEEGYERRLDVFWGCGRGPILLVGSGVCG